MKIPKAKAALDKEWGKLEAENTWRTSTFRLRAYVIAECRKTGKKAHFGSLMDRCGKKNSQLSEEHWIYKGPVVFRGECVKDEQGFHAAFSEQGTSASHWFGDVPVVLCLLAVGARWRIQLAVGVFGVFPVGVC